jgi:hypothetical protein
MPPRARISPSWDRAQHLRADARNPLRRGSQPIRAIQAQLGHRSAQSTEVYAHLGGSAQLRLVQALEPASPPHRGQYLVNERPTQEAPDA